MSGQGVKYIIPIAYCDTDIDIVAQALGVVCGIFGTVIGNPQKFMDAVNTLAHGEIDGSLLKT